MSKKITDKEFKEFMLTYGNKNFNEIQKFKTNKISKFIHFMMFYTGSFGTCLKNKEYSIIEIYNLCFKSTERHFISTNKNLELFEFIYKFQGIDNLKKLTFKQLQEYICYLRYSPKNGIDKKHTIEEIFSSLAYLFKK